MFINDSEDDGNLPHNNYFWINYFHRAPDFVISNMKAHEVLVPKAPRVITPIKTYHKAMLPLFAWIPVDRIRKDFEHTIQVIFMPLPTYLRKWHQLVNPTTDGFSHGEVDATDNILSVTPTVEDDQTAAQKFAEHHSKQICIRSSFSLH